MIKDILAIATSAESDLAVLDIADAVAARTDAFATCLSLCVLPDGFLGISEGARTGVFAELIGQARREAHTEVETLKAALAKRTRAITVEAAEVYPSSLEPTVAAYARHADLVIARAPRRRGASTRASIIEGALIGGGAPVLLAPIAWTPTPLGRRVVIAWDGGREAARASHYALDLLEKDAEIFVVTVSDGSDHEDPGPHLDFAAHLARHGFKAERRNVQKRELSVPGTIQKAAVDLGADMIVMGGYRHSRVQQTLIGGVTRTMMHSGNLPVLFSH